MNEEYAPVAICHQSLFHPVVVNRAVGSNFPLVRWVIELGRPILENEARLLGGSGGMPPQENFGFLNHLRSFLAQSW